jgi:hypothetical protein
MHTLPYPVSPTGKEAAGLLPLPKGGHTMTRTTTRTSRKASTASKPARVSAQAPAPAAEENRADIYQRITDRIAAAIEAGAETWQMPWHPGADGTAPRLPVNAATGKPYRGINTVVLWATARAESYPSAVWATYRQWAKLGAQVRRGEQSSPVVFWKINGPDEGEDGGSTGGGGDGGGAAGEDGADGCRPRVFARGYSVFNAAQVDGYEAPALPCPPCRSRSGSATPRRSLPLLAPTSGTAATAPATCSAWTRSGCRPSRRSATPWPTTPPWRTRRRT